VTTPSIGIEQPGVTTWEPAFGQDFEWTFLHALGQLGRAGGTSAYFRLSTRPVAQSLAYPAADREQRRSQVLRGAYRLRAAEDAEVAIAVMGALVPEAVAAADMLESEAGVKAEVVCVTSADLLYRAVRARSGFGDADHSILDEAFPRALPMVTLLDGHPHTLNFLGSIRTAPVTSLGVERFGQSGDVGELYTHHEIDAESVVGAALDLLDA
jgi:pyruvate dehydrogenase E1 component